MKSTSYRKAYAESKKVLNTNLSKTVFEISQIYALSEFRDTVFYQETAHLQKFSLKNLHSRKILVIEQTTERVNGIFPHRCSLI